MRNLDEGATALRIKQCAMTTSGGGCCAALDVLQAKWGADVSHAVLAEGFNFRGRHVLASRRTARAARE